MTTQEDNFNFVNQFATNLDGLDAILTNISESEIDVKELAELLLKLNQMKRDFSVIYDSFSQKVMNSMGDSSLIELPSGGSIEKKGATERKKWQHPELASRVA